MARDRLVTARQVHGVTAIDGRRDLGQLVGARGRRARSPTVRACCSGVLTADCGPVLLADPEAGVIGAAHAGWEGALGGVLGEVVAAMVPPGCPRRSGSRQRSVPASAQESYEVGPEFLERFVAHGPRLQAATSTSGLAPAHFDLRSLSVSACRPPAVGRVELLDHDTCAEEDCSSASGARRSAGRAVRAAALRHRPGGADARAGEASDGAARRRP